MRNASKTAGTSRKSYNDPVHQNDENEFDPATRQTNPSGKNYDARGNRQESFGRNNADGRGSKNDVLYEIEDINEKMKFVEERIYNHRAEINKRLTLVEERFAELEFTVEKHLKVQKHDETSLLQQEKIKQLEEKVLFLEEKFFHQRRQGADRSESQPESNKEHLNSDLATLNHSIRKCLQNQQELQEQIAGLKAKINISSSEPGDPQKKASEKRYTAANELSEYRKSSVPERRANGPSNTSKQLNSFHADKREEAIQDRAREKDFLRKDGEKNERVDLLRNREDHLSRDSKLGIQNKQVMEQQQNSTRTDRFGNKTLKENENRDFIQSYLPSGDNKASSKGKVVDSFNPSPSETNLRKAAVDAEIIKRQDLDGKNDKSSSLKANELELKQQAIQQNKDKIRDDIENLKKLVKNDRETQRSVTPGRVSDFEQRRYQEDPNIEDRRASSNIRSRIPNSKGELGPDYATFRNDPSRKYNQDIAARGQADFTDRAKRDDRSEEPHSRRKSSNVITPTCNAQREERNSSPPDLDEIQLKTRIIEEKKRKIDMEIEKRIQDENERRRKLSSQADYMQKIAEQNDEEGSKRGPISMAKPKDREVKSRLEEEKRLREDVINKYTDAVRDLNRVKKTDRKNYDLDQ